MRDFFVSYTASDRPMAEWIAWVLEEAGHTTLIQAWDIRGNFILAMDDAMRDTRRTVAVLSAAYLQSAYAQVEWAAAVRRDPHGSQDLLVVLRVGEVDPTGWLAQIGYTDLVGLNEDAARAAVLARVQPGRGKPAGPVLFPGPARVGQPGAMGVSQALATGHGRNVPQHPPYPAAADDALRLQRVRQIALGWRAVWAPQAAALQTAAEQARAAMAHAAAGTAATTTLAALAGAALEALPLADLASATLHGLRLHPAVLGGMALRMAQLAGGIGPATVTPYQWENLARVLEAALALARYDIGQLPRGYQATADASLPANLAQHGPLVLLRDSAQPGLQLHAALASPPRAVAQLTARERDLHVLAARHNRAGGVDVVAWDDEVLYGWWGTSAQPTHELALARAPRAAAFLCSHAAAPERDAPAIVVLADGSIVQFGPGALPTRVLPQQLPRDLADVALWVDSPAPATPGTPATWRALFAGRDGACIAIDPHGAAHTQQPWHDPLFLGPAGEPPGWTQLAHVTLGVLDGFDCAVFSRESAWGEAFVFLDPATLQPLRASLLVPDTVCRVLGATLAGRWLLAGCVQHGGQPGPRLALFDLTDQASAQPAAPAAPITQDLVVRGDVHTPCVLQADARRLRSLQVRNDFTTASTEPAYTLLAWDWQASLHHAGGAAVTQELLRGCGLRIWPVASA